MEWQELEPLEPEMCSAESLLLPQDLAALQQINGEIAIIVLREAMYAMLQHAASSGEEVIGVLRGRVVRAERMLTLVLRAEPIRNAKGSRTSVQATLESWQSAWQGMKDDLPMIGWYHSHPGLGVFFSETDRTSQRRYFTQPWQVGLVVDPSDGSAGAFAGPGSLSAPLFLVEQLLSSQEA